MELIYVAIICFLFFSIIVVLDYRIDKLRKYCDETTNEIEDLKKEIEELKTDKKNNLNKL